jgi:hypothetical protein
MGQPLGLLAFDVLEHFFVASDLIIVYDRAWGGGWRQQGLLT